MNNNRNNRRRGRGSRISGGGSQLNRIDSRARGNAPQLLDKYKKLAQDAQHNGDRVQAEYYLQFADHYFRVIADNKARQDESRPKRGDDRSQANDDSDEDDSKDNRGNHKNTSRRTRSRRDEGGDRGEGEAGHEGEQVSLRTASEEDAQPKRRARKPRDEDAEDSNGEDKPKRRKPRAAADGDSAGIDSSVLPPSIGSGARSEKPGDENLKAAG